MFHAGNFSRRGKVVIWNSKGGGGEVKYSKTAYRLPGGILPQKFRPSESYFDAVCESKAHLIRVLSGFFFFVWGGENTGRYSTIW